MSTLDNVVVVGASLAGLRAAQALRRDGYAGRLTIVGAEEQLPYDRPPLSKEVIRGESTTEELAFPGVDELDAVWRLGVEATALDAQRRTVTTSIGEEICFDGLVLATGSAARTLAVFDLQSPLGRARTHVLRTADDARRLHACIETGTRLLIVGAGFIGIELASSACSRCAEVTVVSLEEPLAVAGPLVSKVATALARDAGVGLRSGVTVVRDEISAQGHVVELSDGRRLAADHVIVAIGSTPNVGWLAGSGATLGDGVLCDASLRVVGLDGVVAAGDIVRWPNPTYGGMVMRVEHWSNAAEQAAAAARTLLLGDDAPAFGSVPSFWSDHFGIRLQSVGLPRIADRFEVVAGDPDDGIFAAAAYAGDVLVGAVAYGMPRELIPFRVRLARKGASPIIETTSA